MNKKANGFGLVDVVLLIAIIGVLASTVLPSLKHHNMRTQFRAVTDIAPPIQSIVDKCLAMERSVEACSSLDKILPYGYSPTSVSANSLIESITLVHQNEQYTLTITPSQNPDINSFINEDHTHMSIARIIDRNGRPVIEDWVTAPQSGCKIASYCR